MSPSFKRLAFAAALLLAAPTARADELTFARALRIARQRAPEIRAARSQVSVNEAQVGLARSTYIPSLSATGSGSYNANNEQVPVLPPLNPFSRTVYTTTSSAAGAFRWTIFDFGRTWNAVDSAEAARSASEATADRIDLEFVDGVANAYLDVVYGERVRDIQRSIVDDRERLGQVVRGLVKQAISPAVEEIRVTARVEAARRDLEAFEGRLAEARVALLALLALDFKAATTFIPPRLPRPRVEMEAAAKEADERFPGVNAARATVTAEEATVSATRARYLPSINVNGDASYTMTHVDVREGWLPTRFAVGSVVLTVPLWDPTTIPRLDAAKASAARAASTYEQVRRDARSAAARSVVALAANERVLEHAKKAAESASAVVAVIRARYAQGLSNIVDLIEAETADAESRIAAVNAERAVDSAVVRVHVATGRASRLYEGN